MEPSQEILQDQDVPTFAELLDQKLVSGGATFAEQAFGLGCSLSIIPAGLVLLVAFILGARNWIMLTLVGAAEGLVIAVLASFLASRSRQRALKRIYRDEVEVEIHQYLDRHQISMDDFLTQVSSHLPESALLVQYMRAEHPSAGQIFENDSEKE